LKNIRKLSFSPYWFYDKVFPSDFHNYIDNATKISNYGTIDELNEIIDLKTILKDNK